MSVQLTGLKTLIRKETWRIIRIWPQTLLPPVITMSLYFLIFGHMIGSRLGNMHGFPYVLYIAPGLIMMAVINNAYANVSSSFFSVKFSRSIEEMLVAPLSPTTIIAGFVLGGMVRGLTTGAMVALVTLFFTTLHIQHPWITLMVVSVSSLIFSLAGLLNAIFAKSFDDISIIPTFILTPLTYLGGVFYSVDRLPSTWHHISLFNPILYLVNAFRYGMLGVADVSIAISFVILGGCLSSLLLVCWWCLKTGRGLRS